MEPKVKDKPVSKTNEKVKEPDQFKVVLLNDHYTTMEFVIEVIMLVFNKNIMDANEIMLDVHNKGKGTVGVFPWDIAATKAEQVHIIAEENEFPLRCIIEPA